MSGDEIRAYVLLGCLVAVYPVMLGVKAIEKSFGPEIAVFDGCRYEVKDYGSYKEGEPLDAEAKACIARHKKEYADNAVFNYQQAHRKHKAGDEVNQ